MSPRYEYDPTQVSSSIETFPKGEYEFQIGEPKAFRRQAGEDQHDSFGVRFPLTIKEPAQYAGKRTVYSIYLQSEGGQSMGKQFQLAATGYARNPQEEKKFNEENRGKDWALDFETGAVGDAWREYTGQRVIGSLDVAKNNRTGDPMQQFASWRPITSGPIVAAAA